MVERWSADLERSRQASWDRYVAGRPASGRGDGHPELGDCARCYPARCPKCPWTPPQYQPDQGRGLAA